MKKTGGVGTAIVVTVLFAIGQATAQDVSAAREADHVALRTLMTNVTEAINNQDVDRLLTYFAKDFAFTAVNQTVLTNAASIKEFYGRMLTGVNSPVTSMKLNPTADVLTRLVLRVKTSPSNMLVAVAAVVTGAPAAAATVGASALRVI